jgi:hypothetical protein
VAPSPHLLAIMQVNSFLHHLAFYWDSSWGKKKWLQSFVPRSAWRLYLIIYLFGAEKDTFKGFEPAARPLTCDADLALCGQEWCPYWHQPRMQHTCGWSQQLNGEHHRHHLLGADVTWHDNQVVTYLHTNMFMYFGLQVFLAGWKVTKNHYTSVHMVREHHKKYNLGGMVWVHHIHIIWMVLENQTKENDEMVPCQCSVRKPEWWGWCNVAIPLQCKWCLKTKQRRVVKFHHSTTLWMVSENQMNENGETSLQKVENFWYAEDKKEI